MQKHLVVIIAIIAIIVVAFFVFNNNGDDDGKIKKNVIVSVIGKDGKSLYNKKITTKSDYLVELLREMKDLKVTTEAVSFGEYITSILSIEQGDGYYWMYYINGVMGELGISSCKLEEGKKYEFRITNEGM